MRRPERGAGSDSGVGPRSWGAARLRVPSPSAFPCLRERGAGVGVADRFREGLSRGSFCVVELVPLQRIRAAPDRGGTMAHAQRVFDDGHCIGILLGGWLPA